MPDKPRSEYPHQWRNCALLIVAHGSTENPDSSTPTHLLVDDLRREEIFNEVHAAFWKEDASMREVMAMIEADTVFVVPMFISEGYFTTEVIPRELGLKSGQKVSRSEGKTIIYTRPSGVHPSMSDLLLKRAYEVAGDTDLSQSSLLVVGHGTALNKQSRAAVVDRVNEIKKSDSRFAEVMDTYMEEEPLISDWDQLASQSNVIVVPFFIADGLHSYQDIPVLLGMESEPTAAASQREIFRHNPHHLRGKTLFYSSAIGTDPSMRDVILDLVTDAADGVTLPDTAPRTKNLPFLEACLEDGSLNLGQLLIERTADSFTLRHVDDKGANESTLERETDPAAARRIALYDEQQEYRPLRTSPDLRTGWLMELNNLSDLLLALDYFYPAAVGLARQYQLDSLKVCHFRDKLGRQTGMYRSARTITDVGANQLIEKCCNSASGCLKQPLWQLTENKPTTLDAEAPTQPLDLICQEPCNILVSEARKAAKREVIRIE